VPELTCKLARTTGRTESCAISAGARSSSVRLTPWQSDRTKAATWSPRKYDRYTQPGHPDQLYSTYKLQRIPIVIRRGTPTPSADCGTCQHSSQLGSSRYCLETVYRTLHLVDSDEAFSRRSHLSFDGIYYYKLVFDDSY